MRSGLVLLAFLLTACGGNTPTPPISSEGNASSSAQYPHPLNDTGTDYCRNSNGSTADCLVASTQDGNTGRDFLADMGSLEKTGNGPQGFDWSKLSITGNPSHEAQWACVHDNHTGLRWEVKSADANSPHYVGLKYSWFDANSSRNGAEPGLQNTDDCNGIACNTQAYIDALNSMAYCGSSRWRLPTVNELMSLVVTTNLDLVVDTNYFPNTKNDQYWSNQTYAPVRLRAWYLYFSDGSTGSTIKEAPNYVRLVAEGESL